MTNETPVDLRRRQYTYHTRWGSQRCCLCWLLCNGCHDDVYKWVTLWWVFVCFLRFKLFFLAWLRKKYQTTIKQKYIDVNVTFFLNILLSLAALKDVAGCRFHPAAPCRPRGVHRLWRQGCGSVPPTYVLAAEADARESVREEHPCLRLLQLHPRQSGQRPGDLWPLQPQAPAPMHQPTGGSVYRWTSLGSGRFQDNHLVVDWTLCHCRPSQPQLWMKRCGEPNRPWSWSWEPTVATAPSACCVCCPLVANSSQWSTTRSQQTWARKSYWYLISSMSRW